MVRISQCVRVVAISTLVAGLTAAQALAATSPLRPPTVPSNYVITPFGYFHPSCVKRLAHGDVLREDKNAVQHANGTFETAQKCAYPHFHVDGTEAGKEPTTGSLPPYFYHSWLDAAYIHTGDNYAEIYAQWEVPPGPSVTTDGQTLFFFNGLQEWNDTGVATIIQPVLGWNSDYSDSWGAAAWNCCYDGNTYEATPIPVSSGDSLEGFIVTTCAAGTKSCQAWGIEIRDDSTGQSSYFTDAPANGQKFNWAFGGVLEAYNITQCGDFPGSWPSGYGGALGFNNQIVLNYNYDAVTPAWKNWSGLASGLSPQCNYGTTAPKQVIITY